MQLRRYSTFTYTLFPEPETMDCTYLGPKMTEQPHVLVYYGDHGFDVEHPEECDVTWDEIEKCGVEFEFRNSGFSEFFTADPDDVKGGYSPTLITIPGRYWIEYWYETYTHHEYGPEHFSGVNLMYPEEVDNG